MTANVGGDTLEEASGAPGLSLQEQLCTLAGENVPNLLPHWTDT